MPETENIVTIELGDLTHSCFVIMPFTATFNTVYERVIRPAVEAAGLDCIRADELFARPQITQDIWLQIRSCRLLLAELTGKNPNVLYELGLAHAIGKPAVIITRNEEDVPFDLKALRYLYYSIDDPDWGETLRANLTEMCLRVVEQQEFGSVFEGISLGGELTFGEVPAIPAARLPAFDVSGVWEGTAVWGSLKQSDTWNLHLLQQDTSLTGTLVVSFKLEDELTVVQQTMAGEINEQIVSLHGIAYSYLERGASPGYDLDHFRGSLMDDGAQLDGTVESEGESGELILKRQHIEGAGG